MTFEVEAVYEAGVLKLQHPLPLEESQRVTVVVQSQSGAARAAYGVIGWQGSTEVLQKIAIEPQFGAAEVP